MINEREVLDYLVRHGMLSTDEPVDAEVSVRFQTRRNRHCLVERSDGSGFFIKLPNHDSPFSAETLAAEGAFYLANRRRPGALAESLPDLARFDADGPVLVLRLLPRHRSLRELNVGPAAFPIGAYREAARVLRSIHLSRPPVGAAPSGHTSGWRLNSHRPSPGTLGAISPAGLQAIEIVQSSRPISAGLSQLAANWRPETLVHGDVRADNIMATDLDEGAFNVRFVDWELWHLGDPAWDVAGALAAAVSSALAPAHRGGSDGFGDDAAVAVLQAACRAVWDGYLGSRPLAPAEERRLALRATEYCAGRLVQYATELAATLDEFPAEGLVLMQVAEHLFNEPELGRDRFLALR